MSLNDKAAAALKRELVRAFPERGADDAGYATLADALTKPEPITLTVRFGTSKGADTYGYTTCTASVDGKRLGSCNGGGYDLEGTAVAEAVSRLFPADVVRVAQKDAQATWNRTTGKREDRRHGNGSPEGLYGLTLIKEDGKPDRATIDGGCGLDCVWRILKAMGYGREFVYGNSRTNVYRIVPTIGGAA